MDSGRIPKGESDNYPQESSEMRTNANRTRSPGTLRDMRPYSGSFVLIISSSLADKELDDAILELIVVCVVRVVDGVRTAEGDGQGKRKTVLVVQNQPARCHQR